MANFQQRVHNWLIACMGKEIAMDKTERCHRFLEESLELVQAGGCTREEANQLVDYVYNRPSGDVGVEVGDVLICLAALSTPYDVDMSTEGHRGLKRNWEKIEKIRAKRMAKPNFGPLPGGATFPSSKPWVEKEVRIDEVDMETLDFAPRKRFGAWGRIWYGKRNRR